jgi:hypothetical protein
MLVKVYVCVFVCVCVCVLCSGLVRAASHCLPTHEQDVTKVEVSVAEEDNLPVYRTRESLNI